MSCNRQCFGPDGLEAVDVDCSECDGRDCGPVNALINYKRLYDIEHRRRVAAEEIALEIEMISDFELSDFNNIKSCRTNLMQIHEAAMKLKSIIKEAGGMK